MLCPDVTAFYLPVLNPEVDTMLAAPEDEVLMSMMPSFDSIEFALPLLLIEPLLKVVIVYSVLSVGYRPPLLSRWVPAGFLKALLFIGGEMLRLLGALTPGVPFVELC